MCNDIVPASSGPEGLNVIIHGTSGASPLIEWRLSADSTCFAGTETIVGTRTPSITSNVPYFVGPNEYDFSSVAPGDYFLCAMVDPYNAISESATSPDNDMRSDYTVTVEACP